MFCLFSPPPDSLWGWLCLVPGPACNGRGYALAIVPCRREPPSRTPGSGPVCLGSQGCVHVARAAALGSDTRLQARCAPGSLKGSEFPLGAPGRTHIGSGAQMCLPCLRDAWPECPPNPRALWPPGLFSGLSAREKWGTEGEHHIRNLGRGERYSHGSPSKAVSSLI